LSDALLDMGFDVVEASSGEEGLALAIANPPDLVLMDLRMPGIDGYEATARLRAHGPLVSTPVIALSADAASEAEQHAIASGADLFLAKPIDLELLANRIRELLNPDWAGVEQTAAPERKHHEVPLIAPPEDRIEALFRLALAGNMRAIATEAEAILSLGEQYRPFVEKLKTLASGYQSPALLKLIEVHRASKKAA
jgi:CheY-like chemotaxis protein